MTTNLNQRLGDNEMDNSETPIVSSKTSPSSANEDILSLQDVQEVVGGLTEEAREKMSAMQLATLIVNKKYPDESDDIKIKTAADLGQKFGEYLREMDRWLRGKVNNTLGKAAAL